MNTIFQTAVTNGLFCI